MSSRGKGKKPLGNEGKQAKQDPAVLNGDEAADTDAPDGCFYTGYRVLLLKTIELDGTAMLTTYHLIEAVLEERARSLPVALVKNTYRHGWRDRWADWLAAGGAGGLAGAMIDPVLGVVVTVVGGLARNTIEVFRLRRGRHKEIAPGKSKAGADVRMMVHEKLGELPTKIDLRGKLPDLPEFNNEWVRLSHRLVRLCMGYDVRVEVVNRIRLELARGKMPEDKAATLESVARGMSDMLLFVRPRLEEVARILEELQPADFKDLRKLEEHDDRLLTNDLLGEDRGEAAALLWLDVPYERILIREAPKVYERDRGVVEGRLELDEELSLEKRFEKLEAEIIRERERLETELATLLVQVERLPAEEQPAARERLDSIKRRLREIASLDVIVEIEVDDDASQDR